MIELKNVFVKSGDFYLKDVSLKIETNSCHCLIGPTGCGKTTLLETILGLRKVEKGYILLDGKNITNLATYKRGFSYVPQDLGLFPHLTVEENIFYGIKFSKVPHKEERYKETSKLAELIGIRHLSKRKIDNLSGGEKQKVALCRAIAVGYKYLLLDEPFSALHESFKKELWLLLKKLQKKYSLTVIMVSHDLEETMFLADYISVMINGVIHQTDKKDNVYKYPSNLEVAKYFNIRNIFNGKILSKENGNIKVYCEELKTELLIQLNQILSQTTTNKITFGIRSEDIMILRPDLPSRNENLVNGVVKNIYFAGPNSTVLVAPIDTNNLIEINIPTYASEKLSLNISKKVTVALKKEKIFIFRCN